MPKREQQARQDAAVAVRDDDALRCCCGSLLARLVPTGVELKCRRCKRQIIIPLASSGAEESPSADRNM
jgi:phage FluMu protein Com